VKYRQIQCFLNRKTKLIPYKLLNINKEKKLKRKVLTAAQLRDIIKKLSDEGTPRKTIKYPEN